MAVHPSIAGASFYQRHVLLAKTPFDQNVEATEIVESDDVNPDLFEVYVDNQPVQVVNVYANRGIILELSQTVSPSSVVEIRYFDPEGDQEIGVPQDGDGEDLLSFNVSAIPYYGAVTQVLDGAIFGVKPGISDEDWFYGNTFGAYVPAVNGSGGQPASVIEVIGETSETFILEFLPREFFPNPSFREGGEGFTAFEFVNETFQLEAIKDNHDLTVGQEISLMDLLDRANPYRVTFAKMGVSVSHDSDSSDDLFYIYQGTSRGEADVFWISLDAFLYESQGVIFDQQVVGASIDDSIETAGGNDRIEGKNGDDLLISGDGDDQVFGDDGDDEIIGGSGLGDDYYDGGSGTDVVKYTSATSGIEVNLAEGFARSLQGDAQIGTDTLIRIESVIGGNYSDRLVGDAQANRFKGGSGDDEIVGGAGIDTAQYDEAKSTVTSNGSVWTVFGDQLTGIERIEFSNANLALDLNGSAGQTAKTLAAVLGSDSLSNKQYVGLGLQLFDAGQSLETVCGLALQAAGATTNEQVVNTLYSNLYGEAPTAELAQPFVDALNAGAYSQGFLAAAAAELTDDLGVIDLVGLAETGIEYV
jgi:hypothetical protein